MRMMIIRGIYNYQKRKYNKLVNIIIRKGVKTKMSIESMIAVGQEKLARKASQMAQNYSAAKARMVQGYQEAGFGPYMTSKYTTAVQNAQYRAPDPAKWARNFGRVARS